LGENILEKLVINQNIFAIPIHSSKLLSILQGGIKEKSAYKC
jgi:hypothetical protein